VLPKDFGIFDPPKVLEDLMRLFNSFPNAELQSVPGLVKLVDRTEIEAASGQYLASEAASR